jgi:hypothetical protein
LDDLTLAWRLQVERNPYLSLGAVFAAGYVLGGGVPVRLVRFALTTGARMAATLAVREALAGSIDLGSLVKQIGGREREGSQRRASRNRESTSGSREERENRDERAAARS